MILSKRILAASLWVAAISAAGACPDCKLASTGGFVETQTMTAKMAFSSSTLLMLGLVFTVVGLLVACLISYCRQYDRFHDHEARRQARAQA